MSDISLTASMRSNLLSLQNTQSLMDTTQERLSTGKKVNSAIDNPSSYYTAQSLSNRASDLSGLLDSMGQAIQTIKAADEGIEAITAFASQAKAVASSALDSADGASAKSYMDQFNNILGQIDQLAKDSGYKGVNLLAGDKLKVTFNEDRSSTLEITGQKADAKSLGVEAAAGWADENKITANVTVYDKTAGAATGTYTIQDNKLYKMTDTLAAGAEFDASKAELISSNAKDVAAAKDAGTNNVTIYTTSAASKTAIETSIGQVETAINNLRTMSSEYGNNYSIVQNREDFTNNLINVLTEGADKLTLADMNEESANMLALQTRQQLAINSLSLASQAAQSVLKLF